MSTKDTRQPGVCYCLRLAIFYLLLSIVRQYGTSVASFPFWILSYRRVKQNGNEKPGFEASMPNMLRHNNDEASNSIYVFYGI